MLQYSQQIEDENSQKMTLSIWLPANRMQNIGSLSGCQGLIGRQSPQFHHTRKKFSRTQALNLRPGGWDQLQQGLFTRYRMFHALLCCLLFVSWLGVWPQHGAGLWQEWSFHQGVIKCLNLNVGPSPALYAKWLEWALWAWMERRPVLSFKIIKYSQRNKNQSVLFDHCEVISKGYGSVEHKHLYQST